MECLYLSGSVYHGMFISNWVKLSWNVYISFRSSKGLPFLSVHGLCISNWVN